MKYLVTFCGIVLLFVGVLCCTDNSRMTAGAAAPVETKQQAGEKAPAGGTTTPTSTPTPIPTCPPNPNPNYVIGIGTGTIVPGTVDIGNHCDDCTTYLTLPFSYQLYDTIFTGVNISSNGNLQFDSNITGLNDYINTCLPVTDRAYSYTIFPFWDDQSTAAHAGGIFTSVSGTAPNRIFNIEWRTCALGIGSGCPNFTNWNYEVRLYEAKKRFDVVYGMMEGTGSTATIGVQLNNSKFTQYSCNTAGINNGLMLTFIIPSCPTNSPIPTQTATPTNIPSPSPTPTTCTPNYLVAAATGALVPGTFDIGNHCDDCTTHITLPFPYQLYDTIFTGVNISSNGNLQFNSNITGINDYINACLPVINRAYSYTIFPFWDDQQTGPSGRGIFTSISGVAPNRIFNIEFRTCGWNVVTTCLQSLNANYEVRLYEGQTRFDVIYAQLYESGSSGTVGVQKDPSEPYYTQYSCDTASLAAGMMLTFTLPAPCPANSPTPTRTSTPTSTPSPAPTLTPTVTPTSIPCAVSNYSIATATGTIVPGTVDIGNHCEDCVTFINLPFPVRLYDRTFTGANISSNGVVELQGSYNDYLNRCLPSLITPSTYSIFAYWDDQITLQNDNGIYTSITGTAPNRIFNIEFRTCQWLIDNCTYELYYEVRLYEATGPGGQGHFDIVYGTMQGTGSSATIGVERDSTYYTQFSCNTQVNGLTGLLLTFTLPPCATATPTPMQATNTNTATHVPTATPTIPATSVASATTQAASPSPSPEMTVVPTSTSTSTTPTPCTIVFTDVPPANTFYPFIRCLACRGIIAGYPCGGEGEPCDGRGNPYFRPNNDITRGQIAKVVSNAAGFIEDPGPQLYEDVDTTNPFYTWINRLSNRGHMGGYSCGTIPEEPCIAPDNRPYFRSFNNATRGQLAKIVSNAAGVGGEPTNYFYTDVPLDHPFYLWVMRLTNLGVMSGYPCGGEGEPCDDANRPYFRPFANVTRGQASKIVANTFFPDCQTPGRR